MRFRALDDFERRFPKMSVERKSLSLDSPTRKQVERVRRVRAAGCRGLRV